MSFHPLVVLHLATSPSPSPSLSQSTPTSPLPGENDPTWIGPGLLGFLSLVFLAVAVFFIYRSLTKQLGRVTFDEAAVNHDAVESQPAAAVGGGAAGGESGSAAPVADGEGPAPTA